MSEQLYFEDIKIGNEIQTLAKFPTTRQLVMWAGASNDYTPIHYDKDYARSRGLANVVVHGHLTFSFLGQLVTDWIGAEGKLTKLTCRYKGMNFPGDSLICKGKVVNKLIDEGKNCVECSIWVENGKGEVTASGTAIVILPSRDCESA